MVAALIVGILAYLVVVQSGSLWRQMVPIDFYQYWGAAVARRLSPEALGSPYRDGQRYGAVLLEAARGSNEPRFQQVGQIATRPNFTATPFAYMLLAALPATYTEASLLFYSLQIVCFLGAVVMAGAVYRYPAFPLVCLALLLALSSSPLNADLRLGNLGCLQFTALAVLLTLADRLRRTRASGPLGGVVLSGFTLLMLAKPNVAPVVVLMTLHLWVSRGIRFLARAALPAVLCGGLAVILSSLYFGSWTVWEEWFGVVLGPNRVGRPTRIGDHYTRGNYSTPLLLGFWLDLDVWTAASLLVTALAVSMILTVALAPGVDASARAGRVRHVLTRVLGDPHLAMAIGITLTIALPPLVWYHYYIIALIPGLWLLNVPSTRPALKWWGLAAVGLGAGLPASLFLLLGWNTVGSVCAALSWLAIWGGILLRLSEGEVTPTPPEAERRREHRHQARPSRR